MAPAAFAGVVGDVQEGGNGFALFGGGEKTGGGEDGCVGGVFAVDVELADEEAADGRGGAGEFEEVFEVAEGGDCFDPLYVSGGL